MHKSAEELFAEALELTNPADRAALLDRECVGNSALRAEVESLLAAHEQASKFLENPPAAAVAETLAGTAGTVPVTEKPGDKIGRYKLLQKIGEGGCGVVYMAEQEEPVHRPVALKIIKLGMDTRSVIARFEAERQALALMDHPHIARVFDGGATEVGRPYFVMELVRGVPITKYCDEHRLDLHERLELFVQVCQAVQHAHQKGVIHRDLKPSNILVAIHDDKQVPKVIDFGIAKATHQRLTEKTLFTRFNQLIGTPAYMSPEQAGLSSLDVDTRSDIYSLGVLLYELLTGRTPFSKEELLTAGYEEICRIIREKEPPKPSTRLSTLSAAERGTIAAQRKIPPEKLGRLVRGELDWVVMKALEKDRKRRYESATALAQDMDRFLNHEPVSAVSPSLRYRGMKFARRNRVPLTAASLFLLVLITGAVMSTVQAIRANRNAKEAKRQYQIATNATDQATRFLTQSRHEEGKAWLERADAYLKEKNYFYAKLMAGRAIGFDGFGRASQSVAFQTNFPILLQSQSAEFRAAERVLKREPDYPLLWQSPIQRHLEGYITAIRFSRDGKNLVTISSQSWSNEVFKVWDVSSGRLLSRHELGGFGFIHVSEAAVAPNGKAVATVRGSVMSLVDLASGKETKVFKGHSDQIRAVAFSPDARKLASSSLDETLRIWDLASGRQISELKISLAKAFEMEFSVDGNVLIGNCSDGFVRGWSLTEEKEIFSVRTTEADDPGHRHLFSLSADGRQLVLVKRNLEQAAVWELPSQIELWRPEGEWKGEWTHFVGFSPRDAYLAIANGGQIKLWDLANRKPLVTLSSPGWVSVIAFSPDEKVLAAATEGGSILTWELPSGRKPSDIDAQAEVGGTPIAFSPDGTQLAFILGYGAALAELYAGRIVRTFASSEPLSALRFSPDGELLATGMYPIGMYTDRSSVQLWDSRSGALKAELNATQVLDLAFSPDAKILATLSYGGVVQLWDVGTAAEVTKLHQPDGYGGSLAFDPDGRLLAVGGVTNIVVWDLAQKTKMALLAVNSAGESAGVAFAHDGRTLFCGGPTIQFWDVTTRQVRATISTESWVRHLELSPDDRLLATEGSDRKIAIWDVRSGQKIVSLNGSGVTFSPDGGSVVLKGAAGVQLWRVKPAEEKRAWKVRADGRAFGIEHRFRDYRDAVLRVVYSSDGRILASTDSERTDLWDAETGGLIRSFYDPLEASTCLALSPDGQMLAVAGEWAPGQTDSGLKLFDVKTGQLCQRFKTRFKVNEVSFSPDNQILATANDYGRVQLWDVNSGKELAPLITPASTASLAFSPDGKLLATAEGLVIRVWNLESRQVAHELPGHTKSVSAVRFSADGSRLASADADSKIKLWDVATGKEIVSMQTLSSGGGFVVSLCFSPTGHLLAYSDGETLSLWDATTGKELRSFRISGRDVLSLAFSPDGRSLASGHAEKKIHIWDVDRLLNGEMPLAQYMSKFQLNGREVVDSQTTADNLYHNLETPFYPFLADTHLKSLQSGKASSEVTRELFWQYLRAQNWASARLMLNRLVLSGAGIAERDALSVALVHAGEDYLAQESFDGARQCARLAQQVTSNSAPVWQLSAKVALQAGQPAQALTAVNRAIALEPSDPELKILQSKILQAQTNFTAALASVEEALRLSTANRPSSRPKCLLERARAFRLIGRYPEAGRDNLEALDIPARAPNTDARLIDLSAFYTASLTEDLHGGVGLNFAALQPFGIKRLGGVDFDVRGIVHLFGRWHEPELVVHGRPISDSDYLEFPKAMREIPIRQKAKTLHFLHAAGFIFGTNVYEMVRFVLHYGDGEERTMPMLHGRDIGDWTEDLYRPNPIDSEVVWTGSNPWVQREEFRKYGRGKIRLFKSSRPNPLPDVEITALDYISLTDGAPFLVAITVE